MNIADMEYIRLLKNEVKRLEKEISNHKEHIEEIEEEYIRMREENKKLKWEIEVYEERLKEEHEDDFIFENKGYC